MNPLALAGQGFLIPADLIGTGSEPKLSKETLRDDRPKLSQRFHIAALSQMPPAD
jgi:hypothetical protein